MLASIYIGPIGMKGTLEATVNGGVDVNRAREHHGQWLEKHIANGCVQELPVSEGRPAPAE